MTMAPYRRRLWWLTALAACGWLVTRPAPERLAVVAIGPFPPADLEFVRADLAKFTRGRVRRLPSLVVPRDAWLPARRQYNAERLLTRLHELPTQRGERVIGICQGDGTRLDRTFVFGLAEPGGTAAVIFTARFRDGGETLYRERLRQTARHELGHLHGLSHCAERRCVMRLSATVSDTDRKGAELCESCRERWRHRR